MKADGCRKNFTQPKNDGAKTDYFCQSLLYASVNYKFSLLNWISSVWKLIFERVCLFVLKVFYQ